MANWFKKILKKRDDGSIVPEYLFPNDQQVFHDDPYPFYLRLRN
jgi:hypothetical protein